ncbi:MAG: glycosyltransferase family 4 protein [Atribacterota bacterium]
MKIDYLLITDYFPPENGSASILFYELAKEMVNKGSCVKVVTGFPSYNIKPKDLDRKYRNGMFLNENMDGIDVYRIKKLNLPRNINIFRGIDQFITAFLFLLRGLFVNNYDCILVYSPPLPLGITGYILKVLKNKKFILNVQDLFPKSAIDLGALNNSFLIDIFKLIEKFVYLKSDFITVHSKGNKKYIDDFIKQRTPVSVVPNWVNIDEITPGPKENVFSRKYNLDGKFVVSFAGIFGDSQDLDIIVDTAKYFKNKKDIEFLMVGEGKEKQRLLYRKNREDIANLKILPMQPKQVYPHVLNSSDVGLVTLKDSVKSPVVPSKLIGIMSSGIPVAGAFPMHGDAPELINRAGAGICVQSGDRKGLINAIEIIYNNKELAEKYGQNGRKFVVENNSLNKIPKRFNHIAGSILRRDL